MFIPYKALQKKKLYGGKNLPSFLLLKNAYKYPVTSHYIH